MSRRAVMRAVVAAPVVVLALCASARAQDEARDREARAHFEAGRTAYEEARYDDALEGFRRSHELSGRPMLLFNMAQCLDRLRRDRQAIDAFERYLEEVPDAPNRARVERRVAALRESERERMTAESDGGVLSAWWFWTIVGVAVVGGAVAIAVGVSQANRGTQPLPMGDTTDGVVFALETR